MPGKPDDKHLHLRLRLRLDVLAQRWQTTIHRLLDEMTPLMLAEFDAQTRFQLHTARGPGQAAVGLAWPDKPAQAALPDTAPAG